jgi:hypothetical protein
MIIGRGYQKNMWYTIYYGYNLDGKINFLKMNFKKGDIVTLWYESDIIFKLYSDPKFEHYINEFGAKSNDLRWLASGKHIGKRYNGKYITQFHLEECVLYSDFNLFKKIKKLVL